MQFAAAVTRAESTDQAAIDLVKSLRRQLPGEIDLLCVFLTGEHRDEAGALADQLRYELGPRVLIGSTCEGIIGGEREIEREPGISVLAARMPGVTLTPFHIGMDDWEPLLEGVDCQRLARRVGAVGTARASTRAYILLGDPYTTPTETLIQALDSITPDAPVVGGMASGASHAGENILLLDGDVLDEGAVGIRVAGAVRVDTVVSQGCRPIGDTLLITRAEGNMIATLGGQNALDAARQILDMLKPKEQELVQNGLYLGIVINEYQPAFGRGDFLVRSVQGVDADTGALAIAENVRAGQTVQFHIRDAETADEDLRALMAVAAKDDTAPAGGLVFSCNGRGVRMFDLPNHDVRSVLEAVPETPLAGFFAAGEIGPIGRKSFVHSHTASIALFRPEIDL